MAVMTNIELVNKAKNIAKNYKTLYVYSCFGAPMTSANKRRYTTNCAYNKRPQRTAMIKNATADTFGFDCVNLIKGIVWGWNGDKNATYGGAKYPSSGANTMPDVNANTMITKCANVSTNFSNIELGEALWMNGHIGIYVGNGLAVECSPAWKNCVQFTAVGNIGSKSGYPTRTWLKHGKLPYIDYIKEVQPKPQPTPSVPNHSSHQIGDIVKFVGNKHYVSANAKFGKYCSGGQAKITDYSKGSKHPYHLIHQGSGSVYGWVNECDIAQNGTIGKGSKVKINSGAVYGGLSFTRGRRVPSKCINRTYTVSNIATHKGVKEALIKELYSWVAVSSLTLV